MEDRIFNLSRPRISPLEIPCILQQILSNLSFQELKQARLISKTFNYEASRILRKTSKIVLSNNSKKQTQLYVGQLTSPERLLKNENIQIVNHHVMTAPLKLLFNKYGSQIKCLDLRDTKWCCRELENILTKFVTNLEEFVIHGAVPKGATGRLFPTTSVPQDEPPRKKVHWSQEVSHTSSSSQKLPNIKSLDLQLYDKDTEEPFLHDFLVDIISASYNLEILRSSDIGKWRNRRELFHRILFELLINPEVGLNLPKLRRVDFLIVPWDDGQIHGLIGKQFPLSYLNVSIIPAISMNALVALLISLRNSLTKLKLSFTYWRITELPCDINLHKLRHLSLDWFNGSIEFVTHLKSLQTLILAQTNINEIFKESEVIKFVKPHRLLSRFEVYQHSGAIVYPRTVQRISAVFPWLKKLVLGKLSDDSLRVVFSKFPLIEELSAIEGAYTDYGVTGIPPDSGLVETQGPRMQKGYERECEWNSNYQSFLKQQRKHFYIGDLKFLRRLEIKCPSLTDRSVIYGVADCLSVRSVSISCGQLTNDSLRKLVDNLNLTYLESSHSFRDMSEIRYAMRKMYGQTLILNGFEAPKVKASIEEGNFLSEFEESIVRNKRNAKCDHINLPLQKKFRL